MAERPTVLHVDDDEAFLDLAEQFLERDGLGIETATDPDAALGYLERVDCVLNDYDMPACGGLELLEHVHDRRPELPFVLFTGKGSEEVASAAISAGVTDYVQKGGSEQWALLSNRVEHAVSEFRARRELRERADRFESIFERHASPMLLVDPDSGRIERANRAAVEFYGYDRETLHATNIEDVNALPDEEVAARRAAAEAGDANYFEFEHRLADGEIRPVDVHSTPISIDGDDVLFSIVHDASDRRDS